jgi:hypothetical protein
MDLINHPEFFKYNTSENDVIPPSGIKQEKILLSWAA